MKIWFIVLMSVLGVLIFGRSAATAQTQQQIQESQVQVSVERANVRDLPSLKGEVIFQVFRDDVLQVVQKEGGWYFVETFSGRRGYISNTVVRSVELRWRPVAPSLRASSTIFENSDVIAMVKAGLSDNIIIAAVRQSDLAEFDLSPAGLIALKESGVSEAVIQALIERIAVAAPDSGTSATPAAIPFQIAPTIEPAARDETPDTPGRFGIGLNFAAIPGGAIPGILYDATDRLTLKAALVFYYAGYDRYRDAHSTGFMGELLYRFPQPPKNPPSDVVFEPYVGGGLIFGSASMGRHSESFSGFIGSGGTFITFRKIPHWRFSGDFNLVQVKVENVTCGGTGIRLGAHYFF